MIIDKQDRRANARLTCSGEANIHLLGKQAFKAAEIMDVSLSGCLLKLAQPMELSIDMLVEVSFVVNQLPFRVQAQVRSVRPDFTIGLKFPWLSTRTQVRLAELVNELSEDRLKSARGGRRGGPGIELAPR